jgi:PAS domain-containing protein
MEPQSTSENVFTQGIGETQLSRQLLQALPVAAYTCDPTGYITMYNKAAVDLWGREPELGKELWCGSWRLFRGDGTVLPFDESPMAIVLKGGIIPEEKRNYYSTQGMALKEISYLTQNLFSIMQVR